MTMTRLAKTVDVGCRLPARLGTVALIALLQSSPLLAVDTEAVAKTNAESSREAEVSWISGGVGDEALDEMRKVSAAYNLHLMFTGRDGHYLAGIPFKVSRRNGQAVLSGMTDGPLLYLKLAPGAYQLAAEIDGAWQTRQIQLRSSGRATKLRFVARGD
jgi:hypothetical protein